MRAGSFFCGTHQTNATAFCLCGKSPVFLCGSCLPKHADTRSHDVFPMTYFGLYQALGNNKADLHRRVETVKHCNEFLDNAAARESAVMTEANNLVNELVQTYQGWLEKNHRCFTTLVEVLREEISLLVTAPKTTLSPLSQILAERSHALNVQEENILCFIPEEKALKEITEHCNKALSKARRLQQLEYENEVQQAFMNLPQVQVPTKGDVQKLIAVLGGEVKYFNVDTSQWQQLLALRNNIQVDQCTSSTFIAPNRIVVCGGGGSVGNACNCHIGKSVYALEGDGNVKELPRMSIGRQAPGLFWDWDRKALYVFGGYDGTGTCYTDSLRTSEVLLSQWAPLPDMHQERYGFNPCWHSSLLYLCGGCTNSVETYDPLSNTFALQDFTLPESGWTTAVVECGVVTMISTRHISMLQQGKLIHQQHQLYYSWSNCTPVVSGGVVYLVRCGDHCCRGIDLTNGAQVMEVKYE